MSRTYKFRDQSQAYFVSFAVVNWIDLFTRKDYVDILLESLEFCQKNKDLRLHAWLIMPSHLHLIIGTKAYPMQDILRDFKRHTSSRIKQEIRKHPKESRKKWLLKAFVDSGISNSNNHDWQLWQQYNHPVELFNNEMIDTRLDYLHNNPVVAGFVEEPEDYLWSSARDYSGISGLLEIDFL